MPQNQVISMLKSPEMPKPTAAELRVALREHMRKLAAKGARNGGRARMANLTSDERRDLARKAVNVRWEKFRSRKKRG